MARSTYAAVALALACCVGSAHAQLVYTGPESFINRFDTAGNQLAADGATISLISAGQVYGSNPAGMSAALITLEPCTILTPHTHTHSEFVYTISGSVTHSTPYNNQTLYNLTANEGTADAGGFALFPSNQLHVTYNPTCKPAQILSVFCTAYPSLNFFPYAQSFLPSDVTNSYFGGCVSNEDLAKYIVTARLDGCKCSDHANESSNDGSNGDSSNDSSNDDSSNDDSSSNDSSNDDSNDSSNDDSNDSSNDDSNDNSSNDSSNDDSSSDDSSSDSGSPSNNGIDSPSDTGRAHRKMH